MNHHRCTRCKEEKEKRHKAYQGLFCEDCLRELEGTYAWGGRPRARSFWGDIWYSIRALARLMIVPFQRKPETKQYNSRARVANNTMQAKARLIPTNPAAMSPQKRYLMLKEQGEK